jgi:CDP-paratose 2-epimerase
MTARHPLLVTGGAGFIGCHLADRLASEGHDVLVFDNLSRRGSAANLEWLRRRHPRRVAAAIVDMRDASAVEEAARTAGAVFHLAAQVAVTTSLVDPVADSATNIAGTVRLLDALRRRSDKVPLVFASTNKVYGNLADISVKLRDGIWCPEDAGLRGRGVNEGRRLDFHTPYGCSKGAADQYVLDAARSWGLPTVVLRMSCIYGPRQSGTEDQGWLAHFLLSALAGRRITLYGDGRQVRDVLFVDDAVDAYVAAWRRASSLSGRSFNLGGGPANAVSLLQVLDELGRLLGRKVAHGFAPWRPGDQRWFVADAGAARAALDLPVPLGWREGLARLAAWATSEQREAA